MSETISTIIAWTLSLLLMCGWIAYFISDNNYRKWNEDECRQRGMKRKSEDSSSTGVPTGSPCNSDD